jgi:ElaB/YqjD/DUF883 family membrane-anchored ribosome-binding protein
MSNNRKEEEIRERIEETRSRMGETIEEIGERMNPDRVKAELKTLARDQVHDIKDNIKQKARDTMRDVEHEVTDTGRSVWATIKENPVPAGMVGVGLAWLLTNRKDASRHYSSDQYRSGPSVPYRAGRDMNYSADAYTTAGGYASFDREEHAADSARDKVSNAADSVRDTAHDAADTVRDKVSDAAHGVSDQFHSAQDRVSGWSDEAQYHARRAERRVEYAVQENPVAAGAVAMAIGLAAGLMIPESQKEHALMGRARDKVMDRAGEQVREASQKARLAAREAIADSAEHLVDEVWPDGGSDTRPDGRSQDSASYTEPRGRV